MGVQEILKVLESGDKLTTVEIAKKVECSMPAVKRALRSLLKDVSEHLEFRILTQEEKEEKYGHKLGCQVRLYWLDE